MNTNKLKLRCATTFIFASLAFTGYHYVKSADSSRALSKYKDCVELLADKAVSQKDIGSHLRYQITLDSRFVGLQEQHESDNRGVLFGALVSFGSILIASKKWVDCDLGKK